MACYSDLSERTYQRHVAQPYEFIGLNRALIDEAIVPTPFQVGVMDASFVPKSGKATYGLGRFYNGKASRAEQGLELSMIAVVDVEETMGYTLSGQQTPVTKPDSEQDTERSRVDDYLDHLRATSAALPATVRYLVGDGFYSKVKWVEGVVEMGLEAISCAANLNYLYDGPQKSRVPAVSTMARWT